MALLDGQVQAVFHIRAAGDPEDMLTTLGLDGAAFDGDPTEAMLDELIDAFGTWFMPQLCDDYEFSQVDIQQANGIGVATFSKVASVLGDAGSDPFLQNTAFLLHKNTAGVGRGKSGRMYVPGVPTGNVNDVGVITPIQVTQWNNQLAEFMAQLLLAPDLVPVVNHGEGSPLGLHTEIANITCDPVVATQRRRLRP